MITLCSCNAFTNHKDDFKPAAHDAVDEVIDNAAKKPVKESVKDGNSCKVLEKA